MPSRWLGPLLLLAACGGPAAALPLHQQEAFSGALRVTDQGGALLLAGQLAFHRQSGHLQFRWDRSGQAVSLRRDAGQMVQALAEEAWRPATAEEARAFELVEALVRSGDGVESVPAAADGGGYRQRVDGGWLTVRLTADRAHG